MAGSKSLPAHRGWPGKTPAASGSSPTTSPYTTAGGGSIYTTSSTSSGTAGIGNFGNSNIQTYTFTPTGVNINFIDEDDAEYSPIFIDLSSMKEGDFNVSFFEEENGQPTCAKFEPDHTISPLDSIKIQTLITFCTLAEVAAEGDTNFDMDNCRPLTFIRKHNLERHFRFSLV